MVTVLFDRESLGNYKAQLALRGIQTALAKKRYPSRLCYAAEELPPCEAETPIIVFCNAESRSLLILSELLRKRYHPIFVVNRVSHPEYAVSSVAIDYSAASYKLTAHLLNGSNRSIAFLGLNSDSIPDKLRLEGFLAAVRTHHAESLVFPNYGDIGACIDRFLEQRDRYRNIVCVNDFHAIALLNRLRDVGEDLSKYRISGFGNTMLARFTIPRIATADPNYELAGQCAVELYATLEKTRNVRAITFTVDTEIYTADTVPSGEVETLRNAIGVQMPCDVPADFYSDGLVKELDGLDSMLSSCDSTDLSILRGLLQGETGESVAEKSFIGINTYKYRLKKLLMLSGTADRQTLLSRMKQYRLRIDGDQTAEQTSEKEGL